MLHGHSMDGNGPQLQTVGYFFGWFIASIFAAYYAMKFAAARRETREAREKRIRQNADVTPPSQAAP